MFICELTSLVRVELESQHYHIDQLFFNPNWEEKSRKELRESIQSIVTHNDKWIIDGNYADTIPIRFEECTLVIILDYPRSIYFTRVLKRIFTNLGRVRPDMAPGCQERLDLDFLKYVWEYDKKLEPLLKLVYTHLNKDTKVLHFRQPKQTEQFLRTLESIMYKINIQCDSLKPLLHLLIIVLYIKIGGTKYVKNIR